MAWQPDVITLDVVMPRLDGFDDAGPAAGRPGDGGHPAVIVTARAQAADLARGEALGGGRLPHQAVRARPSWWPWSAEPGPAGARRYP